MGFNGAKCALFVGDRLLCILRDTGDIPWANWWDFPGGGREGDETPFETLRREVMEEVGITISVEDVVWSYHAPQADRVSWFFVVKLAVAEVTFGNEGQGWAFLTPDGFLARKDAIPSLTARLSLYLQGDAGVAFPG